MGVVDSLRSALYHAMDGMYRRMDGKVMRRSKVLRRIPGSRDRHGGRLAYGEWCHTIGIFHSLFAQHLPSPTGCRMLDIGCGMGTLAIVSETFQADGGSYTGIDVRPEVLAFCKERYTDGDFTFKHLDVQNLRYAPGQESKERPKWSVDDGSFDFLSALSVWTHFNEGDSIFYMREVDRALRPGGVALITMFLLDDVYKASIDGRTSHRSRYHGTPADRWVFEKACSESGEWFERRHVKVPEDAVGCTTRGLEMMLEGTDLDLVEMHHGNWKERPGVYFQDVLVFRKKGGPADA